MSLTQSEWDSCYLDGRTAWRGHHRNYTEWIDLIKIQSGRVLDLGCGTGEKAIWFRQHGFEVDALDYSSEALRIAKGQSSFDCFHQWDLEKLSEYPQLQPSYDVILDIKVLAFIQNKQRYLDTITRLLKGFFILEVIWEHDENQQVVIDEMTLNELIKDKLIITDRMLIETRKGVKMEILFLRKILAK